ncbi:MAG: hypothetical protein GY952_18485 [Rhodobacteraceae bacterium]|nr:hypothetical protein [Paracoccaceae bacterium]
MPSRIFGEISRFFVLLFVLSWVGVPGQLNAQTCERLEAIACIASGDCMYEKVGERFEYACMRPANRCQIGFKQSSQTSATSCENRVGCSYVPAGECYCPPDVDCVCGGGTPPNCQIDQAGELKPPVGRFLVVGMRNASDVAAPLEMNGPAEIMQGAVVLTEDGLTMEGRSCENWSIQSAENVIPFTDPMLSDVLVGPVNSPTSDGDSRILTHWKYVCEGEHLLSLTQIDERVLVIPWKNSSRYLIAEMPLNTDEVARLQQVLKSYKFYDGEITGQLDDTTISALGFWAEYRSETSQSYRFARTAITQNLLDGMGVFSGE